MRTVALEVRKRGGIPFFTETCGLGMGKDQNHAPGRMRIAAENGYTPETLGAPIVIADGLLGRDGIPVDVPGKLLKRDSFKTLSLNKLICTRSILGKTKARSNRK